jgi:hypothetical protein
VINICTAKCLSCVYIAMLIFGGLCSDVAWGQPDEVSEPTLNKADTSSSVSAQDLVDLAPWADTLKEVVRGDHVLYSKLREERVRATLDQFLRSIEAPLPSTARASSLLAYWINAYNALTLRHVLRYPRLTSVATAVPDAPRYEFFKQSVHLVAGQLRSLDDIEHQILRPQFRDPRVHAALNCASRSCPPLSPTPYLARTVHQQLDDVARRFVNDPRRNHLSATPPQLSKIFAWFVEDFQSNEQPKRSKYHGVVRFLRRFANAKNLSIINTQWPKNLRSKDLSFKTYDWSLNGPKP